MCSWNWEKLKFRRSFNFTFKKTDFSNINIWNKWKCLFLLHDWFPMKFLFPYSIFLMGIEIINFKHEISRVNQGSLNKCYLNFLELIKRRSKVQEKNVSCEHVLNFDQWKTFSENYEPMRVWLSFVYKITENCQIYRHFSELIQTQKRYPTSLDKIHILTWNLLVISS